MHLKIFISLAIVFIFFLPSFGLSQERPEGIVLPVATLGNVTETRRQILQNTLIESLSSYYRLVPQDKLEEVQEKIFQEMDYDECTEDQCIVMIQEALQVENLFVLQVIGEGDNTQLGLMWVGLDDKNLKTDVCKGCDTFELNERVEGLVKKLESLIPRGGNFVAETVDEERLKREREEKLRKQREEQLRKKREEELRKQREEELRRQKEWDSKTDEEKREHLEKELKITFRSIGIVSTIDYKLENIGIGVGFLVENSSSDLTDNITESTTSFAIYGFHVFNDCYFCDTSALVGVLGTGKRKFEIKGDAVFSYGLDYLNLTYGYQWFWNTKLSTFLGLGLRYRIFREPNFSESTKAVYGNNKTINQFTKSGFDFYPTFLVGYSF